jgi:hypothetical protein
MENEARKTDMLLLWRENFGKLVRIPEQSAKRFCEFYKQSLEAAANNDKIDYVYGEIILGNVLVNVKYFYMDSIFDLCAGGRA